MELLTTLAAGFVTNMLSGPADRFIQAIWERRAAFCNRNLIKAVYRAYLRAQQSLLLQFTGNPTLAATLPAPERRWVTERQQYLRCELRQVAHADWAAPPLNELDDVLALVTPGGSVDKELLRNQLVDAAVADGPGFAPLRQFLTTWLYERTEAYFAIEIKENDRARHILQTQVLAGLSAGMSLNHEKLDQHTATLQRIHERLAQLTPPAPDRVVLLPYTPHAQFTGRQELLAAVQESLCGGYGAADPKVHRVALHGKGGVGKTQIALRYATSHLADYQHILWLHADQPSVLAGEYASLAEHLGLPYEAGNQQRAIEAVKAHLAMTDEWLIVFDNAETPGEIASYLPAGDGHVIITSRNPNWRTQAKAIPVAEWAPAEAVAFLTNRTAQAEAEHAQALAGELGCLPLALEHAAAYICANQISLVGYLLLYRHHREILGRVEPSTEYPFTLLTTWAVAFAAMESRSPLAAAAMRLVSFLAPDGIPENLVAAGIDAETDTPEFIEAVGLLARYSLVRRGEGKLTVHRLVQQVVRDRLAPEELQAWGRKALHVMDDAFGSHEAAATQEE